MTKETNFLLHKQSIDTLQTEYFQNFNTDHPRAFLNLFEMVKSECPQFLKNYIISEFEKDFEPHEIEKIFKGYKTISTFNEPYIYRVVQVLLDPDDMERINNATGLDPFDTDNWCDLATIDEVEKRISEGKDIASLKNFLTNEQYEGLVNKSIDYIAFRIDL